MTYVPPATADTIGVVQRRIPGAGYAVTVVGPRWLASLNLIATVAPGAVFSPSAGQQVAVRVGRLPPHAATILGPAPMFSPGRTQ